MPTPAPTRIRLADPADPADAEGCLAIYRPFVESTPVTFETEVPTAAVFAGRMREVTERAPWLVAEADGRIVGYAYGTRFRPRPAYQWSVETTVYLAESARGLGLGALLYRNLLGALGRQGFVNALAGIALPNPASVKLHERLGFRHTGTLPAVGYKLGRWHDVGWWHLALRAPPAQAEAPRPLADVLPGLDWEQPA